MSRHTPGPWRIVEKSDDERLSIEAGDMFIARTDPCMAQEANARLIAAAPDLLEALQEVLGYPRGTSGRIIIEREDEKRLRVAIAKAEAK